MDILYKNRSEEDQSFIRYVCNDILDQQSKDKNKNNLFAAIFVEGRAREINSLEDYATFHSFYTFSEYAYPIYAFVNNTENFLNNNKELIDKYNIIIQKIEPLNSLEEYSTFCIKQLYFLIPENIKHIITLQPDAMIIKSGYEEYLLKYDFLYVGAPWLHSPAMEYFNNGQWDQLLYPTRVGNGGMSYRNADFCRKISENYGELIVREKFAENNKKPQEDLFFSVFANIFQNRASIEQARKFSIDPLDKIDYDNKISYAFHYFSAKNPWKT